MHNRESRPPLLGEAPRIVFVAGPILAAAIALSAIAPRTVAFLGPFRGLGVAVGIAWGVVGLAFWASAVVVLLRANRDDRVAINGAFALVRHPIFAWWIWFILPPAALVVNSWALLVCAPVFFFAARPAARREEDLMTRRYGDAYESYRRRVRMLTPLPRLRPVTFRRVVTGGAVLALAGLFALGSYYAIVRPVMLGFGATRGERTAALPGDELIATPRSGYTQAWTIDAPPAEVWPWLVQVGYARAGWYNLDWINRLASSDYFYEDGRSARRIIPELQRVEPGDEIGIVPQMAMQVVDAVPGRRLLLAGEPANPTAELNAVWLFDLHATGDGRTRLVVRFNSTFPGGLVARILNGFVNEIGGAIIQQPAMMHGLARRAERRL
ncbi:MAG: methyltransferase family protein [Spirochaetota bacterium]